MGKKIQRSWLWRLGVGGGGNEIVEERPSLNQNCSDTLTKSTKEFENWLPFQGDPFLG